MTPHHDPHPIEQAHIQPFLSLPQLLLDVQNSNYFSAAAAAAAGFQVQNI